jgi:hypothetical protein
MNFLVLITQRNPYIPQRSSMKQFNTLNINRKIQANLFALCGGYLLWHTLYTAVPITQTYQVPICFYNCADNESITAPESLAVTVKAPRSLHTKIEPLVNIDAQSIPYEQKTWVYITHNNLFLPYEAGMVDCFPSVIPITKVKTMV